MRAYRASDEEALGARAELKDWAGEGFLDPAQYQRMEQETVCDLRRTNVFLRVVLFFFSLIILGAGMGLFFAMFFSNASEQAAGGFLLVFAPISYAAAELVVSRAKLYRYGIEEALVVCSIGFLCAGMEFAFFGGAFNSTQHAAEFMVPLAGILGSLWIWRRFGLPYAFFGAMIFVVWLAADWTSQPAAQHLIVVAFYAAGLFLVVALSPRYRLTYLRNEYSIAEALLWLGIYVAINLQLSSVELLAQWGRPVSAGEFSRTFYWATWVLAWGLPAIVLARGVRGKDRFVIAVGAITAILTLATNKPYLGWPRHTWDPMLLGILLSGVALFLRRWLSQGPDGIRHGFTARRLSGKDKQWMSIASTAFGGASSHSAAPRPETARPDVHFGGGDSGGGGATSDF